MRTEKIDWVGLIIEAAERRVVEMFPRSNKTVGVLKVKKDTTREE